MPNWRSSQLDHPDLTGFPSWSKQGQRHLPPPANILMRTVEADAKLVNPIKTLREKTASYYDISLRLNTLALVVIGAP